MLSPFLVHILCRVVYIYSARACTVARMEPIPRLPNPATHARSLQPVHAALKPPAACPPVTNLTNNTPLCANHRYPGQHRTRTRFANLLLLCQKHAGSHTTKHRPTPRNRHRSPSSVACRRRLCRRGPERFATGTQTSTTNTRPFKDPRRCQRQRGRRQVLQRHQGH
jgi:hypothetical protein